MKLERRKKPDGCCPVDLIAQIAEEEEKRGRVVVFNFSQKALDDMCNYPVNKQVNYDFGERKGDKTKLTVCWLPSMQTMELSSFNGSAIYQVDFADTDEIKHKYTEQADVVYLIY